MGLKYVLSFPTTNLLRTQHNINRLEGNESMAHYDKGHPDQAREEPKKSIYLVNVGDDTPDIEIEAAIITLEM
ncbi:unnamed protein product, partial [marine sediment metagenome]